MKRFVFIAFMLLSTIAFSQSRMTVKGTVKDSTGESVIGAVVMLDGSASTAAVTDANGNWSLTFNAAAGDIKSPNAASRRVYAAPPCACINQCF